MRGLFGRRSARRERHRRLPPASARSRGPGAERTTEPGTSEDAGQPPPRKRRFRLPFGPRTVAGEVFVLQVTVIVLLMVAVVIAFVLHARWDNIRQARKQALAVARTFAQSPEVISALDGKNPTAKLQPRAQAVRAATDVSYVVVWKPDGIRVTAPEPGLIGKRVSGPFKDVVEEAREGRSTTETLQAAPGPTVNSAVPVNNPDGTLIGLVSTGVTVSRVNQGVKNQLPVLLMSAAGALALASGSSALVSRRLRRQTHGLGTEEMTRMYEHHDAVLHAVREGVLILDDTGRLVLVNNEARRLLELPEDAEGRRVDEVGLGAGMAALLASGRTASDEVHLAGGRLLAVNVRSTRGGEGPRGRVATLRDTTELHALEGRAEGARERLRLLYEAGVRVGTTLDVVRTAEELTEVAVPRFADFATVELLDPVLRGEEPTAARTDIRRAAISGIRDDVPLRPVGATVRSVTVPSTGQAVEESGQAVLETDLREAHDWLAHNPEHGRRALEYGIRSLISTPLRARGKVLGTADFWRTDQSEPYDEEDLAFAEELTARAAVSIDNARRYTRENAMAVTLQRSLLPRGLPEQDALEVASRYRPTRAGVGGDWFDVIPLPGARVALVVGDVVGHGLHAAATMGRLRTAVLNFSSLDLTPEELLAHLDELVDRIDQDQTAESNGAMVTGATCLYAIYDSVSGRCTVARAGHPGPALVLPDGTVEYPDVPVGLPLGLGGAPFETAELLLPRDSRLVLFTDGLVEDRERDIDDGLALLHETLTGHPGRSPEETCRAVLDALLPAEPSDDVALLVARARVLAPDRVAQWDVPADSGAVAPLRAKVNHKLTEWGLEEASFTTELILSELVTNAIRYGSEPIRVRLLYQTSLTCEVADGSSTSPHLRRAAATEEGGRGLFLVAQLAERWGTRYTPHGKVMWTEQNLHPEGNSAEQDTDSLLDQWNEPL
ncbi:SpoIIE family protein phosphatase [Streptomyces sp. 891-h]|nr:SpoIIE family protein phosphatase [Streptomyces sp. 891-h]